MHFCYSPAKIIHAVGYESREKLKNLLRPDKMPLLHGVKEADLTVMEQDTDKAIEMIREVDRLREEVTRKLQEANEQLNSLRDRAAVYRKIIKQNYLQDQWAGFGLQDKR